MSVIKSVIKMPSLDDLIASSTKVPADKSTSPGHMALLALLKNKPATFPEEKVGGLPGAALAELTKAVQQAIGKTGLNLNLNEFLAVNDAGTVEYDPGPAAWVHDDGAKKWYAGGPVLSGMTKFVFSDAQVAAIKKAIEPWLIDKIKEVIADSLTPLSKLPPAVVVPDQPLSKMALAQVQSLFHEHEFKDHSPAPGKQHPILINEFSIPHDLHNYRLILRSSFGGQEYEVPMNLLPKLLGQVLS